MPRGGDCGKAGQRGSGRFELGGGGCCVSFISETAHQRFTLASLDVTSQQNHSQHALCKNHLRPSRRPVPKTQRQHNAAHGAVSAQRLTSWDHLVSLSEHVQRRQRYARRVVRRVRRRVAAEPGDEHGEPEAEGTRCKTRAQRPLAQPRAGDRSAPWSSENDLCALGDHLGMIRFGPSETGLAARLRYAPSPCSCCRAHRSDTMHAP